MKRLVSLDFFRGLTIALMIVVNSPGSWSHVYPPLLHAEWNGVTPTDLVFPFFLFIVGVSVALAYSKKLNSGPVNKAVYTKIIRRTITIFLLGIFLALFPKFDFGHLRVVGVLPRIAIVFFVCVFLFIKTTWKTQLKIGIACLIGYWLAMWLVPVPNIGSGSLEPGRNLAAWIDSYLVPGRMYRESWDPEGFFSTIPAVATGISGMLIGHILLSDQLSRYKKIIWIFFFGFTLFLVGNIWGWFFPLNKNLWTSSYVLFTSGLASMFLAASMWIIDELGYKRWTKTGVVFGMNAISAYVLHGILWRIFQIPISGDMGIQAIWMRGLGDIGLPLNLVSLLWALAYTMLCYVFVWVLYKKKIIIKV